MSKFLGAFFSLLCASYLTGADINEKIDLQALSQERTWLRLLYFDEDAHRSEIVSDDYFLSADGRHNPLAELNATINAYNEPFTGNPDEHPRCRFPARYQWLSRHIALQDYRTIPQQCATLQESSAKTRIDSISLMFVSGYLGNPASSFGHSFLKLNNHSSPSDTDLFDLSVSYGADVPKDENIFLYMYRGLFGEYEARFSDKYFYSQDLVYTNNEFRDIWEYELNLPKEKVEFFQLHLWEILGKKFQYFFLNKNCGYEVSKMLEVIIEQDLAKSANFWFAPIETFHALNDINGSESLIGKRAYHPSEQKKVYKRFQELNATEKQASIDLIRHDMSDDVAAFDALSDGGKINVVNFALSYYRYLLVKERKDPTYEKLQNKALIKRFSLPVKRDPEPDFGNAEPPDRNDRPSIIFSNFNSAEGQKSYGSIGYAPYAIQSLGQNNLNGDELVVLESEIGYTSDKLFLKKFDLIRIKRFDRYQIPLNDEQKLSWQLTISLQNVDIERDRYDAYIQGGIGKTWVPYEWFMAYAMIHGSLHSRGPNLLLAPEIGARMDFGRAKTLVTFQKAYDPVERHSYDTTDLTTHLKLGRDISLTAAYRYCDGYRFTAGIQLFF